MVKCLNSPWLFQLSTVLFRTSSKPQNSPKKPKVKPKSGTAGGVLGGGSSWPSWGSQILLAQVRGWSG